MCSIVFIPSANKVHKLQYHIIPQTLFGFDRTPVTSDSCSPPASQQGAASTITSGSLSQPEHHISAPILNCLVILVTAGLRHQAHTRGGLL